MDELVEESDLEWDENNISLADLCPEGSTLVDVVIDTINNDLYVIYIDEEEKECSYNKAASLAGSNTLQ